METQTVMEIRGFSTAPSGGGCEWYTKEVEYKGGMAFVAITDDGGIGLPESLEEPVYVGVYDAATGDTIEDPRLFDSLRSYLDSME